MASPFITAGGFGVCINTTLTGQNFATGTNMPFDTVVFDPEGLWDACAYEMVVPAKYAGCSAIVASHSAVNNISAGTGFCQLLHKDACSAIIGIGYAFNPFVSSQVRMSHSLIIPALSEGDTISMLFDSGTDTSVDLVGTGGDFNPGCWMMAAVLPTLGQKG